MKGKGLLAVGAMTRGAKAMMLALASWDFLAVVRSLTTVRCGRGGGGGGVGGGWEVGT